MELQYRIAERNDLYYPQVRIKKYLFWGSWYRIGVHPEGFGLYQIRNFKYGDTLQKVRQTLVDFDKWYKSQQNCVITYYYPII